MTQQRLSCRAAVAVNLALAAGSWAALITGARAAMPYIADPWMILPAVIFLAMLGAIALEMRDTVRHPSGIDWRYLTCLAGAAAITGACAAITATRIV